MAQSDEEAEREAWKTWERNADGCVSRIDHEMGFRAGLAAARSHQAERIAALERVAGAAREWLRHLESHGNSRFQDGLPGELFDAVEALDRAKADTAGKDSGTGSVAAGGVAAIAVSKVESHQSLTLADVRAEIARVATIATGLANAHYREGKNGLELTFLIDAAAESGGSDVNAQRRA